MQPDRLEPVTRIAHDPHICRYWKPKQIMQSRGILLDFIDQPQLLA